MFKPIECWVCSADMNYVYDKDMENMGSYRFDCTKCDESVLCPKEAPFLEINNKIKTKERKGE